MKEFKYAMPSFQNFGLTRFHSFGRFSGHPMLEEKTRKAENWCAPEFLFPLPAPSPWNTCHAGYALKANPVPGQIQCNSARGVVQYGFVIYRDSSYRVSAFHCISTSYAQHTRKIIFWARLLNKAVPWFTLYLYRSLISLADFLLLRHNDRCIGLWS